MSLGMYAASVPAFLQMLKNMTAILEKAEAFAEERNIEPEVMLNWRLAPDMFPLVRQIQIAADFAKGTTARLAGAEVLCRRRADFRRAEGSHCQHDKIRRGVQAEGH